MTLSPVDKPSPLAKPSLSEMQGLTRRSVMAAAIGLPLAIEMNRPASAQARSGHIRYALSTWPPNLQPWVSVGVAAGTVKMLVHRRLVSFDTKGELRPELALSWGRTSDGAWEFKLRPGVVFHDGTPFTSADVRWTIEQIAGERSTAFMRAQFTGVRIETPDPLTIRFLTPEPNVTFPLTFANYNMPIGKAGSEPANPVGCGPYRIVAQERGTSYDLAAFDRFYQPGIPRARTIKVLVYADENLRYAALQAGDIDACEFVPWTAMAAVETDPRVRLASDFGPFMDVLFNGTRPPFNDPRVRRAVAHAVRREDIVKVAFSGRGRVLEGMPIVEGTPWYDATLARGHAYDPRRSRELLAAAGFPNGFSTTILATAQFNMHKDTAEIVQQHLAEIGIQGELQLPDWPTRVSRGTRGQYDMAIHGVASEYNDPDGLSVVMDPSLSPTHGRSFGLSTPRTSALFAQGRAEFDQAKRVEIYRELQRAALEEVPLVGLAWREQGFGLDRRIQGFQLLPGAIAINSAQSLDECSFNV
jgi:peptide/nickel transport system substrate-binding protein